MRKSEIWTLEVHDVLEANQYMIKNFMQWYIKTKCIKKGGLEKAWDAFVPNMAPKTQNGRQKCATSPLLGFFWESESIPNACKNQTLF